MIIVITSSQNERDVIKGISRIDVRHTAQGRTLATPYGDTLKGRGSFGEIDLNLCRVELLPES